MFKSLRRAALIGAVAVCLPALAPIAMAQESAAPPAAVQPASPFLATRGNDILTSNLIDAEVTNADGKRLGEIEDLVFDVSGQVRAVVVALGARAGAGERHVLVQFTALHLTPVDGGKWRAELDATPDQVKSAPIIAYHNGWNE